MATEPWHKRQLSDRVAGVFLLLFGGVLGYFGIVRPYMGALAHEADISLSFKLVAAFPLVFGLGLIYALYGRAVEVFGPLQTPKRAAIFLGLVLLGLGIGLYFALSSHLGAVGYG